MYPIFSRLPERIQSYLLQDAAQRDPVTARRVHLVRFLLRERYLTRETLIFRVEAAMGSASFGVKSRQDNFYRDLRAVKAALKRAGWHLKYSRTPNRQGYYFAGEAAVHPDVKSEIAGALDELDPQQIEVYRHLSPEQKFAQACALINLSRRVAAQRRIHG
jgi:hypothetical protein